MPILYLHVGPHKTGSTYLQNEFAKQEKSLKMQGIVYPASGREFLFGHHNTASFFRNKPLINTTQNELSERLLLLAKATDDKLLLSSENFMSLTVDGLNALRLWFHNYDFHVIYFRRTDLRFFFSLWHTMVTHGSVLPFDEVDLNALIEFYSYNPFAYEENESKLRTGLGCEVTSLDYTELRSQGVNLLEAVCKVFKVTLNSDAKTVNPSLSAESVELIRAANLYSKGLRLPQTKFLRKHCLSILRGPSGDYLTSYMKKMMVEVPKELLIEHLTRVGFPSTGDIYKYDLKEFRCIPGRLLLDKMERDGLAEWETLKTMINESVRK